MAELIRADQVAGPLIGLLRGADMNTLVDQAIVCTPKRFIIRRIIFTNASISLTTAAGGVFTGLSQSGVELVPAAQSYAALTTSTKFIDTSLGAETATDTFTVGQVYLKLTTPQGAAATADVYIYGEAVEA